MLVRNAMIPNPVTVSPDASIGELAQRLLQGDQELAAVLGEDAQMIGVVGMHDIMAATVPHSVAMKENLRMLLHEGYFDEHFRQILNRRVRDVMRTEVDGVRPGDPLISAVALFVGQHRRALPVREDGRFFGIVTRSSVLQTIAESSSSAGSH